MSSVFVDSYRIFVHIVKEGKDVSCSVDKSEQHVNTTQDFVYVDYYIQSQEFSGRSISYRGQDKSAHANKQQSARQIQTLSRSFCDHERRICVSENLALHFVDGWLGFPEAAT